MYTIIKAHKIRLNPTPKQAQYFTQAAGTRRFVYNWGLAEWKRQYEAGEKPSALALKKQFNAIRGDLFPWTYAVTKCAIEGAFMDLAEAFQKFFKGRKSGRKVGYPKFKTKKRSQEGFYVANDKFEVAGNNIKLPHIGWVNMTETLRFAGKILSARFTQTAGWWFVSIAVEMEAEKPVHSGKMVGVDVGLNRLVTLSDGNGFESQKPLRHLLKNLKRLQRDLSRKQKGSANREKAWLKLARLHYRIACIRDDALHKITTQMAKDYRFIGVETLHVRGMMQNHALAQALSDAAFGRFAELLEMKVPTAGGILQPVGRFFPSSKRCHVCHAVRSDLTLSERIFECPHCGLVCDRDTNASRNILQEAIRLFESSL